MVDPENPNIRRLQAIVHAHPELDYLRRVHITEARAEINRLTGSDVPGHLHVHDGCGLLADALEKAGYKVPEDA